MTNRQVKNSAQSDPTVEGRLILRAGYKLWITRLLLLWEALARAFWPLFALAVLFAGLVLTDAFPLLSGYLHLSLLLLFALAALALIWRAFSGLEEPGEAEAIRRLETASGLEHRPLASLDDQLSGEAQDRGTQGLWLLHRRRLLSDIARLRLTLPRPNLARLDPLGLRFAAMLLLVLGIAVGAEDWRSRLLAAVSPSLSSPEAAVPLTLDLWISPPAYTGIPPLFLDPAKATGESVTVPIGSELQAQVQGATAAPEFALANEIKVFETAPGGVYRLTQTLSRGGLMTVRHSEADIAAWPLTVTPDTAPQIEYLSAPSRTERSVLRFDFSANDDFGIAKASAVIARLDNPGVEPITLEMTLPGLGLKSLNSVSYHDLTPHPWAGLAVEIHLTAIDAVGQVGRSDGIRTVIPERIFNHPVARALIELRRQLTLDPTNRYPVIAGLDTLAERPAHFFHDIVVALALRSAEFRLAHDRDAGVIAEVQQLMWETALRIEDGELAILESELRQIQDRLMEALRDDADDEELAALMEEFDQLLQQYMEQLAQELSERAQLGELPQLPDNMQMINSRALQDMLEQARQLAESGLRDAAREMLAELRQMLENLSAQAFAQQDLQNQLDAWDMMRDAEGLANRQQELLDRVFGRTGRNGERADREGERPGREYSERRANQADSLSQERLRRDLGELMRRLAEALGDIPRPLSNAEQAMRRAEEALRENRPGQSLDPQSEALDQLQQGIQAMAERFMNQLSDNARRGSGQTGAERGNGRDPFGRENGNGFGREAVEGVEIPDANELQRAREILQELRRRRDDSYRPQLELDYLDRLLERF